MTPPVLYTISKNLYEVQRKHLQAFQKYWIYRFSFFVDRATTPNPFECSMVKSAYDAAMTDNELTTIKTELEEIRDRINYVLELLNE